MTTLTAASAASAAAAAPTASARATSTVPGVSRAVNRAAHAAALTLLPSGLWRIAMAVGIDVGWGPGSGLEPELFPGVWSLYLVGLSVFAECLGLLTLGLVQRWGEVLPGWVPWLGGRRIPPLAAVVPAALGAAAVTVTGVMGLFTWGSNMTEAYAPAGGHWWLMTLCYAPLVLWGPLLAVVTAAYWRRRRLHG
ncbi:hypothetical protein ACFCV9_19125 [Streptomyces sp. NPDC056367]|uniref:hypothetical protein n=1 Tax=Streptomyces sp. NPDC056367 TaxID=3345797 RepID=UPI0035E2228B